MVRTYEVRINGQDPTKVEHAFKVLDRIVRRLYNVYGGRRTYSEHGLYGDWYVYVEYTADWDESGLWFDWYSIKQGWYRKMSKIDRKDELEFQTRELKWKYQRKE